MTNEQRVADVVGVVSGRLTVAQVAARHGVDAAEVETWRAAYVAGLEGALRAQRPTRRRWPWLVAGLALVVGVVSLANTNPACGETLPGTLQPFCPDQPAIASELNQNYRALIALVEGKIGALSSGDLTIAGAGTFGGAVTAGPLTAGRTTFTPTAVALDAGLTNTIVADSTANALVIAGRGTAPNRQVRLNDDVAVTGDLAVNGDLTLAGRLIGGGAQGTVAGGGTLFCNFINGNGTVVSCNQFGGGVCPPNGSTCTTGQRLGCPAGSTPRDISRDCSTGGIVFPCTTYSWCLRD